MTSTLQERVADCGYWYHRIELPDGVTTPGWAPLDPTKYGIPDRMDGERVLDVGAWDGYWTFEAMKRGASSVVAIDDFSDTLGDLKNVSRQKQWHNFDLCRDALGYKNCQRYARSVYDIGHLFDQPFDRVFFFGTIYHLRHPLLALDVLRKLCCGTIHIESAILDGVASPYTRQGSLPSACHAEFYPGNEYGANHSNWWVPTLRCLHAMTEAAGFTDVESWHLEKHPRHISQCRGFVRAKVPI